MTIVSDKPDTAEQYACATNATNLRVEADRPGKADTLIAAGWSASRLGAALLRLHSEWDGCEHLSMSSKAAVAALAQTLPRLEVGQVKNKSTGCIEPKLEVDIRGARDMAYDWHVQETKRMLGKLKSLPQVRYQIELQADKWNIDDPKYVASSVIQWWLDRSCKACQGTKFELVPGTNRQSAKFCRVCRGTSQSHLPCGESGRRIVNYMDDCVERARRSIKDRLQNTRKV